MMSGDRTGSGALRRLAGAGGCLLLVAVLSLAACEPDGGGSEGAAPAASAPAPTSPQTLKIGTRLVKPFVIEDNGQLTGFSIELWRQLAAVSGLTFEFDLHSTLAELLSGVVDGPDEAAIAAISITADREKVMDFSQPIFKSGLGILVPESGGPGALGVIAGLLTADTLQYGLIFLLILLIPAHVIWFAERGIVEDNDIPVSRSYFPGIFQAVFWSVATTGGQAEGYPKTWISRVVSLLCIYASIIFIAYFTAYISSAMTVQQMNGDISGPQDLVGKRVATVKDSTGARYLHRMGVKTLDLANIDEVIEALLEEKADAVVYDAPMLLYFAGHEGAGKVRMAGATFADQDYAIAFKDLSELRKTINSALLVLRENGDYDKLYQKWFGLPGGR